MVSFGDSLSDVGTYGVGALNAVYGGGKYTINGPQGKVWTEYLAAQLGASFRTNQRWFFDVAVIKTFISNTARLSTGQAVKLKLDPLSVGLSMGYEFP